MDKNQQDENYKLGPNVYLCQTYIGMEYILIQDEIFFHMQAEEKVRSHLHKFKRNWLLQ